MKYLLLASLCLSGCLSAQDRTLLNKVAAQQKVETTQMAKIMSQQELVISVTLLMADAVEKVEQAQTKLSGEEASRLFHQRARQ